MTKLHMLLTDEVVISEQDRASRSDGSRCLGLTQCLLLLLLGALMIPAFVQAQARDVTTAIQTCNAFGTLGCYNEVAVAENSAPRSLSIQVDFPSTWTDEATFPGSATGTLSFTVETLGTGEDTQATATEGEDFVAVSQSFTYEVDDLDASIVATVSVPLLDDDRRENQEQFYLQITAATSTLTFDSETIDVDSLNGRLNTPILLSSEDTSVEVEVSFVEDSYSVAEDVAGRAASLEVQVTTADGRSPHDTISVAVSTRDGTASGDSVDYGTLSDSVISTADSGVTIDNLEGTWQATIPVLVPIFDDDVFEEDETFVVSLSTPSSASSFDTVSLVATPEEATVTIVNDEAAPAIATIEDALDISIADEGNVEEGEDAVFTITRSSGTSDALIVNVLVNDRDGTASGELPTSVSFGAGESEVTLRIPTRENSDYEGHLDRKIFVDLADENGGDLINHPDAFTTSAFLGWSADLNILDDDPYNGPVVSIAGETSARAGDNLVLTLSRTTDPAQALTVNFGLSEVVITEAAPVIQAGNGLVFRRSSGDQRIYDGQANFAPGATTTTLIIPTIYRVEEGTSAVTISLLADKPGSGNPPRYVVTEEEDDQSVPITVREGLPRVSVTALASEVDEGEPVQFTLTRNGDTAEAMVVSASVRETGDVLPEADRDALSLTIEAGMSSATFDYASQDDNVMEEDSVVTLEVVADVADPTTYTPGSPTSASVTVADNDRPTFAPSSVRRSGGGGGGGSSDCSRARDAIREVENLLEEGDPSSQAQEKLEEAQRAYEERDCREARTLAREAKRLVGTEEAEGEEETEEREGGSAPVQEFSTLKQALTLILGALEENKDCNFTRTLSVTSSPGADILCLQCYLNMTSTPVATTGPGSPGRETTVYGSLTKQAVARWQRARGLEETGIFGPSSQAHYHTLTTLRLQLEASETVADLRPIIVQLILYVGRESQ